MIKLSLTNEQFHEMAKAIAQAPHEIFLSSKARQTHALERFKAGGSVVRVFDDGLSDGVMPGTIAHNRIQIDDGTFASANRSARLLNPLSSIDVVYKHAPEKRVLSIGPRTEMELLHLVGLGFSPANIRGIDLISTSPWIDLGDMHKLPYPDRSFDICISSWVLAYSSTPQTAVDEMLRVTRSGGLIAIGCTHNPDADKVEYKIAEAKILGSRFRHVAEYIALIGDKLDFIYFQDEPRLDEVGGVILIASIKH